MSPHSIFRYLIRISENPEKPTKALVRRRQSNFAREVLVRPIFDPIVGSTFGKAYRGARRRDLSCSDVDNKLPRSNTITVSVRCGDSRDGRSEVVVYSV